MRIAVFAILYGLSTLGIATDAAAEARTPASTSTADRQASAEDTGPIDPKAAEIVLRSAYFLADLPAFSFNWFISSDEVVDGREKITYVESGSTTMKRDTGFFSRIERGNTHRDNYFDGKEFSVASPDQHFYATVPFSGSYDQLIQRVKDNSGVTLPMWTMLSTDLPAKLVAGVDAAAYLGTTLIAGQEAHHVAFSSPDGDWQIWISIDEAAPLPLMLIGTRTDLQGWPQYRVNMMDWDLSPDVDPSQFKFTPDGTFTRIALPWRVTAPDADAQREGGEQ